MMSPLNLPEASLKTRAVGETREVFDVVRRKFVALTPEEWVRQHFLHFLINNKQVPATLIAVEKSLKLNKMIKRADILVYENARPLLLVECKAASVKISQDTFDQVARYNITLRVPFLVVTNGLEHYCCLVDVKNGSYRFLEDIPGFGAMASMLEQL